jgi:hypothetical protein
MSTALRPALGDARRRHGTQANANLHKNRFVFSPFARIDCRNNEYGRVGFSYIEPGTLHMISDHTYPIPNQKRLESGNTNEPEFADFTWEAGYILESFLRGCQYDSSVPTGFDEIPCLLGLDPDVSESDAALLEDLQITLLPELPTTAFKQLELLMQNEKAAIAKGDVYVKTWERMAQLTDRALDYARVVAQELRDGMGQRQAGIIGHRGRLFSEDKRLFAWIEEAVPELRSPFAESTRQAQPAPLPALTIPDAPRVQCESCGAFANIIQSTGLPPKKCAVCKAAFEIPKTDVDEFAEVTGGN